MSAFYGTLPANNTSKWHPEPTFRGTYGILSSCLITMTLCIWTAVHLNLPEHNAKGFIKPQTWRKMLWLVTSLFAPELVRKCNSPPSLPTTHWQVAWMTFKQLLVASWIHDRVSDCFQQRNPPDVRHDDMGETTPPPWASERTRLLRRLFSAVWAYF